MKLDWRDVRILEALAADGRMSLREVADRTGLTTPTVSYRFSRMVKAGLIRGFTVILNPEVSEKGVDAFVTLKTKAGRVNDVVKRLSDVKEVVGIYETTGEQNLLVRVHCEDPKALERLLTITLPGIEGAEVVSSQMIVKVAKDERSEGKVSEGTPLKMKCDYCKGEIASEKPYNIKVGQSYHYFCCKTCRREFIRKYDQRIRSIKAKIP